MSAVIQCEHVSKSFSVGDETVHVLRDINVSLSAGDTAAVVGASGSGKTTLINILGGLDAPDAGVVSVGGRDFASMNEQERGLWRNQRIGFVFQFHHLLPEFSALENAAMPLLIRGIPFQKAAQSAGVLLERVGLAHRLQHKPAQLSGGERQRVAIARALVGQPDCILLDEPTGNLDQDMAQTIQSLLLDINRDLGTALIVVTHDMAFAARLAQRYTLDHGVMVTAP